MSRLLAIDPSPSGTGLCIIEDGDILHPRLRLFNFIELAEKQNLAPTHHWALPLFQGWFALTLEHEQPDELALEVPGVAGATHFDLWGSGTVIAMHHHVVGRCVATGLPFKAIVPRSLKKFHTGSGTATKAEMVRAANRCGVPKYRFHNDNLADAFLLARWALGAPAPTALEALAAE